MMVDWSLFWRFPVAGAVVLCSLGYWVHGMEHGKPANTFFALLALAAAWAILFRYAPTRK